MGSAATTDYTLGHCLVKQQVALPRSLLFGVPVRRSCHFRTSTLPTLERLLGDVKRDGDDGLTGTG